MKRDVYFGRLKISGEEDEETLREAFNYAGSLIDVERFEEAKSLLRRTVPVARRILGEEDRITLIMRWIYALALSEHNAATLGDLREAVETLESVLPLWKRVLGESNPETPRVQSALKHAREREALAARAAGSSSGAA